MNPYDGLRCLALEDKKKDLTILVDIPISGTSWMSIRLSNSEDHSVYLSSGAGFIACKDKSAKLAYNLIATLHKQQRNDEKEIKFLTPTDCQEKKSGYAMFWEMTPHGIYKSETPMNGDQDMFLKTSPYYSIGIALNGIISAIRKNS